jgi:hypothetical protein
MTKLDMTTSILTCTVARAASPAEPSVVSAFLVLGVKSR